MIKEVYSSKTGIKIGDVLSGSILGRIIYSFRPIGEEINDQMFDTLEEATEVLIKFYDN
jgi:hypothetical protein